MKRIALAVLTVLTVLSIVLVAHSRDITRSTTTFRVVDGRVAAISAVLAALRGGADGVYVQKAIFPHEGMDEPYTVHATFYEWSK